MKRERQVPYAVMNYREIVGGEYFFVDHTRFLCELEQYKTPVFLRPKRFGKSLWVSLLEHYYDVRFKGEFQKLFGKTDVGREPTRMSSGRRGPTWSLCGRRRTGRTATMSTPASWKLPATADTGGLSSNGIDGVEGFETHWV